MDSTLQTALLQPAIRVFHAVRVELPSHTVNLLDGSGVAAFSVNGTSTTFTGYDSVFGVIASVSKLTEAVTTESPSVQIMFVPPTASGLADIANPTFQLSPVYVWMGVIDGSTGSVVGIPELVFTGSLDTAKVSRSVGIRNIEMTAISGFDRLFIASEGDALTDTWHQNIYPGENGLTFNILATQDPQWGTDAAQASAMNSTPIAPQFNQQDYLQGIAGNLLQQF